MWVREMINLHLMCKLITSIDLKGQCGPLDLRFLMRCFWRNRMGQKRKSLLFILGVEEEKRKREQRRQRRRQPLMRVYKPAGEKNFMGRIPKQGNINYQRQRQPYCTAGLYGLGAFIARDRSEYGCNREVYGLDALIAEYRLLNLVMFDSQKLH